MYATPGAAGLMAISKVFYPLEHFKGEQGDYQLLPFRFMRWNPGEVLLVNDVGEYLFVADSEFLDFVGKKLSVESEIYQKLSTYGFLARRGSRIAVELLATKLRTKKEFLVGFTRLHIFVVTLRCDTSCRYCQVSRVNSGGSRFDMSEEVANLSIELMMRSPADELKVEFQGGEPLLNVDRIEQIINAVEAHPTRRGRRVQYVVATHLGWLSPRILELFKKYSVKVSTSLDGPRDLHEANRPKLKGSSYLSFVENLKTVRAALGDESVSAIMTTTERSLGRAEDIVDEYVHLGFDEIFLRPVSPYGFAVRTGESQSYDQCRFLDFYSRALDRVIEWNRRGVPLREFYAKILLTKILTPFATGYVDLQSPTGLGVGVVVYNYDGDVFASDESRMLAEMGDRAFKLGNVHQDKYEQIFHGESIRRLVYNSVQESWPGCSDCAFLPYCGTDLVFNYRTQGDIVGHRPTSEFCARNMGILKLIFGKLRGTDEFVKSLLVSWACAA